MFDDDFGKLHDGLFDEEKTRVEHPSKTNKKKKQKTSTGYTKQKPNLKQAGENLYEGFGMNDVEGLMKLIRGPSGKEKLAKLKLKQENLRADLEALQIKKEYNQELAEYRKQNPSILTKTKKWLQKK